MKSSILILIISILSFAACKKNQSADQWFTKEEQLSIINQSVRYSVKTPPDATHQTKFDSSFNWYYDIATKEYDWRAASKISHDEFYFLLTRKARSVWPAREAIGGKIKIDSKRNLIDYEEIFRTWKMAEDSLNIRAFELFDLMAMGKDLTPYQSKYKGDRYIEFPDDRWHFNKTDKRWRDKLIDSTRSN
jgi:hypothetical protein